MSTVFQDALVRWWPSGNIEDGEPDMPHNTYWERESNLYVDFSDYSENWIVPIPENPRYEFGGALGDDPYSKSLAALSRLQYTRDKGLYNPEVLVTLNDVFSKCFINDSIEEKRIIVLYSNVMERLERKLKISPDTFEKSALMEWPLYYFLQAKR